MCVVNSIACPTKWADEMAAGIDWYNGFMKRHPRLSLRTPEGCSLARATSFNPHNVMQFYNNLDIIMQREPKFGDGTRIFNLDETGTTTVHIPPKVIAEKGVKQVSKCTSGEKGTLATTCCIINAAGNSLPPAMIFPRVHFRDHMLRGAPPGTLGLANKTGWMNSELFSEDIDHFIHHSKNSKDQPSLLVYDNHESHLSIEVLDKAKENGVTILTLPPHSSNKMQPLDVGVYKPFKTYYSQAMDSWMMRNPGKPISTYEIAHCVGIVHQKAMTPANITAAFRKTGIFPFDKTIFTEAYFLSSAVTDRPAPSSDDGAEAMSTAVYVAPAENVIPQSNTSTSDPITSTSDPSTSTSDPITSASDPSTSTSNPSTSTSDPITSASAPSKSTPDNSLAPQRFNSPTVFKGYPKAMERKSTGKGRRKGSSLIATDTPVKDALEKIREKSKRTKPKQSKRSLVLELEHDSEHSDTSPQQAPKARLPKRTKRVTNPSKGKSKSAVKKPRMSSSSSDDEKWPCIICGEPFEDSKSREVWVECQLCKKMGTRGVHPRDVFLHLPEL